MKELRILGVGCARRLFAEHRDGNGNFFGALTRPNYVLINLTIMLIDHFCNPLQIMHSS